MIRYLLHNTSFIRSRYVYSNRAVIGNNGAILFAHNHNILCGACIHFLNSIVLFMIQVANLTTASCNILLHGGNVLCTQGDA